MPAVSSALQSKFDERLRIRLIHNNLHELYQLSVSGLFNAGHHRESRVGMFIKNVAKSASSRYEF